MAYGRSVAYCDVPQWKGITEIPKREEEPKNVPGDKRPKGPSASGGERPAASEAVASRSKDRSKRAARSLVEFESKCLKITPVLDQRGRWDGLWSRRRRG